MKPEHGDDGWIPLIRRSDAARVIAERDARIAELEEERRGVIAQSKMIEALNGGWRNSLAPRHRLSRLQALVDGT